MAELIVNVYLIQEDGESFCVRSHTMRDALKTSEDRYLSDPEIKEQIQSGESTLSEEIEHYYSQILQSCSLVGELKN